MIRRRGLALIGAIVLAGCSGTAASLAPPSLGPAALTIQAVEQGIGGPEPVFDPNAAQIASGGVLRLVLAGQIQHNLTIDATGLIPTSGATRSDRLVIAVDNVTKVAQAVVDLPPGTYRFYCSIDFGTTGGHARSDGKGSGFGMVGTLTVH